MQYWPIKRDCKSKKTWQKLFSIWTYVANLSKISSLVKKFFCDNKNNITKFQNPHEKGKKEV